MSLRQLLYDKSVSNAGTQRQMSFQLEGAGRKGAIAIEAGAHAPPTTCLRARSATAVVGYGVGGIEVIAGSMEDLTQWLKALEWSID